MVDRKGKKKTTKSGEARGGGVELKIRLLKETEGP